MKLDYYASIQTGPFGSQLHEEDYVSNGTPIITVEHLGEKDILRTNLPMVSDKDKTRLKKYTIHKGDIVFSRVGSVDRCSLVSLNEDGWLFSGRCLRVRCNDLISSDWLYYYFCQEEFKIYIRNHAVGATMPSLNTELLKQIDIVNVPSLHEQKSIASVLSSLDRKIALNRKANELLESMAKQLYDYWFVQFDFPNEEGKPYKSSGGKMVYNETLKRDIPEGWEVKQLAELLELSENGEWGQEEQDSNTIEVNCIRGADIVDLIGAPTRYLPQNKTSKLMQEDDIIVEISGGSPTQATGRCNYVSKEILELYHDKLTCSNFCKFLRLSDRVYAPYFYYLWTLIYKNGNMFHYEGKTSGIKNLQIDNLLAEYWYIPPKHTANSFCKKATDIISKVGKNKTETLRLTSLRDYLLPLLMNGQVKVS